MADHYTYVSKSTIRVDRYDRRAEFADADAPLHYGVMGGLRDHYGVRAEMPTLPAPVDQLVAAVGACMHGTLQGALRARKVDYDRSTFVAEVEGTLEGAANSALRVTRIHVRYQLAVPADQREAAERAVAVHARACPVHESVKDSIDVTWTAEFADR